MAVIEEVEFPGWTTEGKVNKSVDRVGILLRLWKRKGLRVEKERDREREWKEMRHRERLYGCWKDNRRCMRSRSGLGESVLFLVF